MDKCCKLDRTALDRLCRPLAEGKPKCHLTGAAATSTLCKARGAFVFDMSC